MVTYAWWEALVLALACLGGGGFVGWCYGMLRGHRQGVECAPCGVQKVCPKCRMTTFVA